MDRPQCEVCFPYAVCRPLERRYREATAKAHWSHSGFDMCDV